VFDAKLKYFNYTKMKILKKLVFFAVSAVLLFGTSCTAVKPYQKMWLNQDNMTLSQWKLETFENGIESYREGASGANGGKTGGGCGCN